MDERVKSAIRKYSLLKNGDSVVVGLSGGPDSVCLLSVLARLTDEFGLTLHAVYVDHNLRPAEVPGEIQFCTTLCEALGVGFSVKRADVPSYYKANKVNKQEAARKLRYRALEEVRFDLKADKIALGHNADDQIETFLIRLLRGAGPKGLSGIPAVRGAIIRPLIETDRNTIETYLGTQGISFVVDSSNLKNDYLRNNIRWQLMPVLEKYNPNLRGTLMNTIAVFKEEERFFEIAVTKTLMKLISRKRTGHIELFLAPLEGLEVVLLRRVLRRALDETTGLREIGFDHIEGVIALIKSGKSGDRIYLPGRVRAIKDYSLLIVTSEKPLKLSSCFLEVPGQSVLRGAGVVLRATLGTEEADHGDGKYSAVLDGGMIQTKLTVRSRKPGDFFYPFGFGKRKKVQDFFVDEKVPRDERDSVPIVLSGEDLVWVAGYRPDERFRVTTATKTFLKLELLRGNF